MERRKSHLRWYWFLGWEVRLAVGIGVLAILAALPIDTTNLVLPVGFFLVLALQVVAAYQRRLYERMGPDRVSSTKIFSVFWRVVAAIETMVLAALLLRMLKPLTE